MSLNTTVSIVIPTYNSASVLQQTLASIDGQTLLPEWSLEVIVSDDGSTDETVNLARSYTGKAGHPISMIVGDHAGAATARNRGVAASRGALVLFLGADIRLRPGAVLSHIRFYEQDTNNNAAVGFVMWDPALPPSPLMEWAVHGGPQNNFDDLLGQSWADPAHFSYGSHLSIRRSALGDVQWPEVYSVYGWEDLDYGRQLKTKQIQLGVLHDAVGHHAHFTSLEGFLKRQYTVGRELHTYRDRYPEAELVAARSGLGKALHTLYFLSGAAFLMQLLLKCFGGLSLPTLFSIAMRDAFWRGYHSR